MSWNDVGQTPQQQSSSEQVPFLRINSEARVRVLSEPELYLKHFTTTINGRNTVIKCPGFDKCILCQRDGKPKNRYIFLVLDRTDGKVKIYDSPATVAAQMKTIRELYGELTQYDVSIKRLSSTRRTDYQVLPLPKSDLTNDEMAKIQMVLQTINLKDIVKPHSPEEIEAILYEKPLQTTPKVAPNVQAQIVNPFVQPVSQNVNPQPSFTVPQYQAPNPSPVGQPYSAQKPVYVPEFQTPNAQDFGSKSFGNIGTSSQGKVIYVEPTGEVSNQNTQVNNSVKDIGSAVDVNYFNKFLGK